MQQRIGVGIGKPIEIKVLVYQRIVSMAPEMVSHYLAAPDDELVKLTDPEYYPDWKHEVHVGRTIITKLKLMFRQIEAGQKDDLAHIKNKDVQGLQKYWVFLRQTERLMISKCMEAFVHRTEAIKGPKYGTPQQPEQPVPASGEKQPEVEAA